MEKNHLGKKIVAFAFCMALVLFPLHSGVFSALTEISEGLAAKNREEYAQQMAAAGQDYTNGLWKAHDLVMLNGAIAKILHMQNYFSNEGIYITQDGVTVGRDPQANTNYEYEQTMAFKAFLDQNGIKLLYVNQPVKYTDDSVFKEQFGIESYSNRNADLLLQRLEDGGVAVLDLRQKMRQEGLDVRDMFYRTDHHWTTPSGWWAAQKIAEALNLYCGYDIDTGLYAPENYDFTTYKSCWLGEQGAKVGESYVGLDDYTSVIPRFSTKYIFKTENGDVPGTFDGFVDQKIYQEGKVYKSEGSNDIVRWHYSYSARNCINELVKHGKILLLCDSYAYVMEPFLSLGVHETDFLLLRNVANTFDLQQYILDNGYDTVIIAYAQFMIGAHDTNLSADSRMFTFQ